MIKGFSLLFHEFGHLEGRLEGLFGIGSGNVSTFGTSIQHGIVGKGARTASIMSMLLGLFEHGLQQDKGLVRKSFGFVNGHGSNHVGIDAFSGILVVLLLTVARVKLKDLEGDFEGTMDLRIVIEDSGM